MLPFVRPVLPRCTLLQGGGSSLVGKVTGVGGTGDVGSPNVRMKQEVTLVASPEQEVIIALLPLLIPRGRNLYVYALFVDIVGDM